MFIFGSLESGMSLMMMMMMSVTQWAVHRLHADESPTHSAPTTVLVDAFQ